MKTIEATATTTGSRADVWALLADASKWSEWGGWTKVEVEGGAEHGPGAIRIVHKPPLHVRERVTEWVPQERMGYEIVDGMKVEGYRSTVSLEDAPGGGTTVRWRSTYDKAGPFNTVLLRLAIRDAARRLAKAAGR
jgi:uncharacterized protein YndB with AHSA1/START domain